MSSADSKLMLFKNIQEHFQIVNSLGLDQVPKFCESKLFAKAKVVASKERVNIKTDRFEQMPTQIKQREAV